MPEETTETRRQARQPNQHWKKAVVYITLIVSVALVVCALWIFFDWLDSEVGTSGKARQYCCPEVVARMSRAANTSLDPCKDFYSYVCFRWNELLKRELLAAFENLVVQPAIQGRINSQAGRAIAGFYRSCLSATTNAPPGIEEAVVAVLDAVGRHIPRGPRETLRLLLKLSLVLLLSTPVKVTVRYHRNGESYLVILTHSFEERYMISTFQIHKTEALYSFNNLIRTNVTLAELHEVEQRITVDDKISATRQTPHFLGDLVPALAESDWKEVMKEFYAWPLPNIISRSRVSALQRNLAFISERQPRLEVQMALLTIQAVAVLTTYLSQNLVDLADHLFYCEESTKQLAPLLSLVSAEVLTQPTQDNVVRALFETLRQTVAADAAQLLDRTDAGKLQQRLDAVQFVVTKDLVNYHSVIPHISSNLYQNQLSMRIYELTTNEHKAILNITEREAKLPFTSQIEFIGPNVMIVPSDFYSSLLFKQGADASLNAAAVGVDIAIHLWWKVLNVWSWSEASKTAITRHFTCSVDPDHREYWTAVRLALKSVLRAVQPGDFEWHEKVYVWSLSFRSRSQVFYMYLYFSQLCAISNSGGRRLHNDILRSVRDFRQAYGCSEPEESCPE